MSEISKFISTAWKVYKKNFWQILIALILVNVVSLIPLGIGFLVSPLVLFSFPTFSLTNLLASGSALIVGFVLTILLSTLFTVSMLSFYQEALKKKPKIRTIFLTLKKFWLEIIILNLIVGLCLLALFGLLELPAFFLIKSNMIFALAWFFIALIPFALISILFSFSNFYLILKKRRILESIRKSIRLVKKNYLQVLGIVVIFVILAGLVSIIPYAGALINLFLINPLQTLTFVVFFSRKG